MESQQHSRLKKSILIAAAAVFTMATAVTVCASYRWNSYRIPDAELVFAIENQSEKNILSPLPYRINSPELNIGAKSAILINASNGNILYEKNADEVIPPASMTKLFCMYVVEEEIAKGNFSYSQTIPLPPESWACNMPPHSSLMFLGKAQIVTMEELLLGLSICSGNDASYALAYTVCGSMEAFVERMNKIAEDLDLKHTHFVESSGYSELNTTTAREMAEFARIYIAKHPDSIKRFHSQKSFTYPKEKNLAPGDKLKAQDFSTGLPEHITMPITQKNTNPLLGLYDGCDGLKTGYIDESGYNLALTVQRNGTRFISVTMGGKGSNTQQGQEGRIADGSELMDWAFTNFKDADISDMMKGFSIKNFGTKEKKLLLIPEYSPKTLTMPFIAELPPEVNSSSLKTEYNLPDCIYGCQTKGKQIGSIKISLEGYLLQEIPLVCKNETTDTNIFWIPFDKILYRFAKEYKTNDTARENQ